YLRPNSDTRQMTFALTNNILERPSMSLNQYTQPFAVYCRNNLFIGGTFYGYAGNPPVASWGVYDNLFDGTLITATAIPNSNNGYIGVTAMSGSSGNDKFPASGDYQTGPLGTNYYPTTGGNL